MTQKYPAVHPDDFMKFGGEKPSHLRIEEDLISIAGSGPAGNEFKKDVLKLAGWTGSALTTYASRAQVAADAFNKINAILVETSDPDAIKSALS